MFTFTILATALSLASLASAAPAEIRAYKPIHCQDQSRGLYGPPSELRVYSTYQAIRFNQTVLPDEGVRLGLHPVHDDNDNEIIQDSQGTEELFFRFDACSSQYMGYDSVESPENGTFANTTYGHIVYSPPDGSYTDCLTVSGSGEFIVPRPCSFRDDETQLNQTWMVQYPNDLSKPAEVTFLGKPKPTTNTAGYYTTTYELYGGNDVVNQVFVDGLNFRTSYQLGLLLP